MFNSDSPTQLSQLFFGGIVKVTEKVCVGVYKTGQKKGQPKLQNETKEVKIAGLGLHPHVDWKTAKPGIYSTNEAVLSIIAKRDGTDAAEIAKLILELRGLRKQLGTYYEATAEAIYSLDSCIHQNYLHCYSDTSRLSCRNPNVQNQPKPPSLVMAHFTSRFQDGKIIAADYKQLELVVQAELSGDVQYQQDVKDGIDFHCKRLAMKEGITYESVLKLLESDSTYKYKRSQVKGFSFSRAYGAGAKKIAEQTGMQEQEVLLLIEREKEEYPMLSSWQEGLKKEVNAKGQYRSLTGRLYKFKKYPAPQWLQERGTLEAYSPTEAVNYMVQGTATGDLVLIMLGKFWRECAILNREKYLLINTVHDSIMLDCRAEHVPQAKTDLKVLERWAEVCYNTFKYNWTVPIQIDTQVGNSWFEV